MNRGLLRRIGLVGVVLAAAWAPLLLPGGWARQGFVPDLCVLLVTYVALRGHRDRAACLGVALGLLAAPFSVEPPGVQAFLLGALGWTFGQADRALYRDRLVVQVGLAALGVPLVRLGGLALTGTLLPNDPVLADFGVVDGAPTAVLGWVPVLVASVVVGAATGFAAPAVFRLLRVSRVLEPASARPAGVRRV